MLATLYHLSFFIFHFASVGVLTFVPQRREMSMNTRNHLTDGGVAGGILYEFASKTGTNEGGYWRILIFMISHDLYF